MINYYVIKQNNSGAEFLLDENRGIGHYLIIENTSTENLLDTLNDITEDFDWECQCCGERWIALDSEYNYTKFQELDSAVRFCNNDINIIKEKLIYLHKLDKSIVRQHT